MSLQWRQMIHSFDKRTLLSANTNIDGGRFRRQGGQVHCWSIVHGKKCDEVGEGADQ